MILELILTAISYLLMGALFAGLGILLVRDDLVAKAIANGLRPKKQAQRPVEDTEDNSWMYAVESMSSKGIPPVVCVQVLANRLRTFQSEMLTPLNKRLETLQERLMEMMRTRRRTLMAHRFENSQLIAGLAKLGYNDSPAISIATNTDELKKKSKKIKRKPIPLSEETAATPLKISNVKEEQIVTNSTTELRTQSIAQVQTKESFIDSVTELAISLVGIVIWVKDAITSRKYRKRVFRISRSIGLFFKSIYFRTFIEKVLEIVNKFIKLTINVKLNEDTTKLSFDLLPDIFNIL